MNYINSLWVKLPDTLKVRLISVFNTFGSTFVFVLASSLVTFHSPEWTAAFWGGILMAALREAFKAVVLMFTPVQLGGRKK